MTVPLIDKPIRLNQLCKLLDMMVQDPDSQANNITIFLDDTVYHYTMLSGEIKRVMVDDISYDAEDKILCIYASTEHDPDATEVEFDGDDLALYKFFDVMYNALDHNRNMFIPGVMVYVGSGDKDDEKFYYNGLPDENDTFYSLSNIKRVYVLNPVIAFTTCTFVIHI